MKQPHMLAVTAPPDSFAGLVAAAREAGMRVGWLEWGPLEAPPSLKAAAALGVLRAVGVDRGRIMAVKPLHGQPVLRDLVREHFLGCSLVLVSRGEPGLPRLEPHGSGWQLLVDERPTAYSTPDLIQALRRPRPFVSGAAQNVRR